MSDAHILGGPIYIYLADAGTVQPQPPTATPATITPAGTWSLLGVEADYSEDGLTADEYEEINDIRTLNSLYIQKRFRVTAGTRYEIAVKDFSMETLAKLRGNVVDETARTPTEPGYRNVDVAKTFQMDEYAALIVGYPPYDDAPADGRMHMWHPRVTVTGPGSRTHQLSEATEQTIMIEVMEHKILGVGQTSAVFEAAGP